MREKSDRGFASELGIDKKTFQQYRQGQYWASLESEWNEKQAKLKEAEMKREKDHIEAYGDRYQADLEAMQKRLADISQAHIGIANQLAQISGQAAIAISQEIRQNPRRAAEACNLIQRKGVAQTALDSAKLSKEARENFAEAYGLWELLDNLDKILDNLKHKT